MKSLPLICIFILLTSSAYAQSYAPLALFGTDACGRTMPYESEVREFKQDRYVGVFYFLWLKLDKVFDNSQILKNDPMARFKNTSPPWGPFHAFHFWGEPMYGYYRSDDPWVLRRHASLLSDAGVDFLVFDTTNALVYENVVNQLCRVFEEQRRQGEHVPQITFMVNSSAGETAQKIYESWYEPGFYPDLWFYWKDKPLLICDPDKANNTTKNFFTLRKAHWPFTLVNTKNAWHWESTYPQVYSYDEDPSKPEQVNVSVGQNLHQDTGKVEMMSTGEARGRSFHNSKVDVRPNAYNYGFNFEEQWQRAFDLDPEVVFVTGWNEWIAMQLNQNDGPAVFCDQYNLEFSRDVEMDKYGYTDNYYMQMAANIRRYKGMKKNTTHPVDNTIDVNKPFTQWDAVQTAYFDHALDTLARDYPGCGEYHYTVTSGRNDFHLLKVTQDQQNLYFYAQAVNEIIPATKPSGMWLLIDNRDVSLPDWEGFNFIVNRKEMEEDSASIEICTGGWNWSSIGNASYRVHENKIHIVIPKDVLNISSNHTRIEFKWIDNMQEPGNILDLYTNGDAAPGGRFRYRFEALSD